jgi:DNA-directed RNA polymerase specialized sigma24 family protein
MPASYATLSDVRVAVGGLTDADYGRLLSAARYWIAGTSFVSAQDLLHDVLAAAFEAANDGPGRRWRTDVTFMAYLWMTAKGVASDSRRSARRWLRCIRRPELADSLQPAPPGPEQILVQEDERRQLQRVRDHFKDDAQVGWIIRGILEELPARTIMEKSGMSSTDYESAHRRWRRGLERLSQGTRLR